MDFSSMNMTAFFISLGIYIVVLGLDVAVPWLCRRLSAWLNYINIVLHIIFLLSLMFVGVSIEIPVLGFMISLFVYSMSFFVFCEKEKQVSQNQPKSEQKTGMDTIAAEEQADAARAPVATEQDTTASDTQTVTVETIAEHDTTERGGSI